ncbi:MULTISPECIES: type II secretion system protein N [Luteimonas]|uniref:type II secretion system protein N n=1 Tax=Luteimonas TaxID=83614 RepID=UPI000C7B766C|nr:MULTISPECIES: type II secretion system protein N [Luteimonas]
MSLIHRWTFWLQILLAIIVMVQLGRIGWLLIEPLRSPEADVVSATTSAQPPPLLAGHDPFFSGASAATVAGDAAGWRLFGLRTGPDGGSAILAHEGDPQRTFGLGEALEPGVVLAAVAVDHVLLRVGGSERRLEIPDDREDTAHGAASDVTAPAAPAPVQTPAPVVDTTAARDVNPSQLLSKVGLRLTREAGRVAGYTLLPRGDSRLVRAAGLQPGDVLLSVNGDALDPERLPEVLARLQTDPRAVVTYRRDGQIRTVTLGSGTE